MIGERLSELRKDMGLTQKQLAEKLGVSENSISLYERNLTTLDDDLKILIAKLFNISLDYLIGAIEQPLPLNRTTTKFIYAENIPLNAENEIKAFLEYLQNKYKLVSNQPSYTLWKVFFFYHRSQQIHDDLLLFLRQLGKCPDQFSLITRHAKGVLRHILTSNQIIHRHIKIGCKFNERINRRFISPSFITGNRRIAKAQILSQYYLFNISFRPQFLQSFWKFAHFYSLHNQKYSSIPSFPFFKLSNSPKSYHQLRTAQSIILDIAFLQFYQTTKPHSMQICIKFLIHFVL